VPISHEEAVARYRRIVAAREAGGTLEDIALAEGVSRERIRQILAKGEPNPSGRPPGEPEADLPPYEEFRKELQVNATLDRPPTDEVVREVAASYLPSAMKVGPMVVPNRMAFATLRPSDMEDFFFVSAFSAVDPRSPAPRQHGYQRDPMTPRLPGIARYFLKDDHQFLITPIIVSVRLDDEDEIAEFIKLWNAGDIDGIHERWYIGVVSVVDGQHRYLGLVYGHLVDEEFDPVVPVMLYFGLSYEDEAEMFDIINSTQRKLPKALIEVTKGDITEAGSEDHSQVIRGIAFALVRDKDSVWYEDVNMTGARNPDRPVTYEGIRRSTQNMFSAELIGRLRARGLSPEKVAKDYWGMVAEANPDAWNKRPRDEVDPDTGELIEVPVSYRLKELVGVASVAKLGKDILTSALEATHFNDRMSDLVSLLGEVDWEKREGNPWMASQAGFAGQKELYTMLHNLVYLGIKPGEEAEN
jgi:DGQHR domain-containing protein